MYECRMQFNVIPITQDPLSNHYQDHYPIFFTEFLLNVSCYALKLGCYCSDEEPLKIKKSELRLYCDLLMQQVHSVKCAVQDREQPDVAVIEHFVEEMIN